VRRRAGVARGCSIFLHDTARGYGWVGPIWPNQTRHSAEGLSHSAEGLTSIPMVFVLVLCKILPLLPEFSRATFAQNNHLPIQKLTSAGRRFKSPFFLWQIQILKAVTMGVVAACGTFLARIEL
jgi:hypothetical protein